MFTLSKKADYGLSLLAIMAKRGKNKRVSLKELDDLGYPRAFMGKIAASLVEGGVINSKEGKGGGYGLNYDPKEIGVREVLEIIEGRVETAECDECPMSRNCKQIRFFEKLTGKINKVLEKYSVYDLTL